MITPEKTMPGGKTMKDKPAEAVLARIDKYELLRELGEGGFGAVYLARDTVAGVDVAIKGLPPEVKHNEGELEPIRANFALVSRLRHPNIVGLRDLHRAERVSYASKDVEEKLRVFERDTMVVMDYAPGATLAKWRKQFPDARVPLDKAIEITRQIASALDAAHAQRVLHRDIKPENVMVETREDGASVARVLDFGLAAEIRSSMGRVSRKILDTSGTRPYMAPEQWLGEEQNAATDQYALAVLFHELVTGKTPFASVFDCGDTAVMRLAVTTDAPKIPTELPKAVRRVLETALAKKPEERFATCGDFVAALEGKKTVGRRVPTPPSRKSGVGKVLAALALVAAIGVGGWLYHQNQERRRASDARATEEIRKAEKPRKAEKEKESKPAAPTWQEVQKAINDSKMEVEIVRSGARSYMNDVKPFRSLPGDFTDILSKIDSNWDALEKAAAPTNIDEAKLLPGKAKGHATAIAQGLKALKERRDFYVDTSLSNAKTFIDKSLWEKCVEECDKVLGWDASNAEALRLKDEAQGHLAPTARAIAKIGDREVSGAKFTIGGKVYNSPVKWDSLTKGNRLLGGDVSVEYTEGDRRYVGTLKDCMVDWIGLKVFAIELVECKSTPVEIKPEDATPEAAELWALEKMHGKADIDDVLTWPVISTPEQRDRLNHALRQLQDVEARTLRAIQNYQSQNGSRVFLARQVQYYKSSGEVENAVVQLSQVMSETGIPISWQKWYFAQRAKRARKQGNTIVADVYDKFVRTLQTEYGAFK